jgi:hypothetical protein
MTLRFSPGQAWIIGMVMDPMIQVYLQIRYGGHWQWYWLNWEQNHELLI